MCQKISRIIYLVSLICIARCFHNPGIVIQIPKNYTLPVIHPQLPQQIPSIVFQNLQLTNVELRQIVYTWRYDGDKFVILLQYTLISFDWKYGRDSGIGTFVQQYSDLVIQCTFNIDKDSRFKIDVDGAKITNQDKRHSIKISLGGKVPQVIVVQVTNLILNHAKVIFRAAIKSAIVKVVQAFTEPLRQDVKLWCKTQQQNKQQCIYLNTTLVGKPTIYDNTQLIQINGAPYKTGHKSEFLDPPDAMFKVNSTNINIQMHQYLITKIVDMYIDMSPINITINSTEISSVTDIDSQTLSVLFPKMRDYDPRPVLLHINVERLTALFNSPPYIGFQAKGTLRVQTQNHNTLQPYISRVNGTVTVKIQPIIAGDLIGARINNIKVDGLQFNPADIDNKLVRPEQITKHLPTLMQWAQGGINGDLNTKKYTLQFATLRVNPKLSILTNSLNTQIVFTSANQTQHLQQL